MSLDDPQPDHLNLSKTADVIKAVLRWYRAFHHGTTDEYEIQEQLLQEAVARYKEELPDA